MCRETRARSRLSHSLETRFNPVVSTRSRPKRVVPWRPRLRAAGPTRAKAASPLKIQSLENTVAFGKSLRVARLKIQSLTHEEGFERTLCAGPERDVDARVLALSRALLPGHVFARRLNRAVREFRIQGHVW